ncbi:hypothetical protein D3C78_1471840 [compost metagenome]
MLTEFSDPILITEQLVKAVKGLPGIGLEQLTFMLHQRLHHLAASGLRLNHANPHTLIELANFILQPAKVAREH